jgi:hypothetical protein
MKMHSMSLGKWCLQGMNTWDNFVLSSITSIKVLYHLFVHSEISCFEWASKIMRIFCDNTLIAIAWLIDTDTWVYFVTASIYDNEKSLGVK